MTKARRDKGDGSLYFKESENRWVGSFYLENGKRKYVSGAIGGTKKEARLKLDHAKEQAKRGQLVSTNTHTLAEYLEKWFEAKGIKLKPGTRQAWKNYLSCHVIDSLGKWQLQKIKREHIQHWVNEMHKKDLAASSIHLIYNVLHIAFNDAVKRGMIGVTPLKDIELPRIEEKEMMVLDPSQARIFLQRLEEENHHHHALFTLALTTGMRQGEILALRWSDLQLDQPKPTVRVSRSVKYVNHVGNVETEPKTRGSRRTILLTEKCVELLKAHRKQQREMRIGKANVWEDMNLVFCGRRGKHLSGVGLTQEMQRILARAGLPKIRFHDLRHTAATLLLLLGASLKFVQKILGHADIKTTMRYLHLLPEMEERDISRLNDTLFEKKRA